MYFLYSHTSSKYFFYAWKTFEVFKGSRLSLNLHNIFLITIFILYLIKWIVKQGTHEVLVSMITKVKKMLKINKE